MLKDLLNKETTLDLASQLSSAVTTLPQDRASMDPRLWLATWALHRSIAAERKTVQCTGASTAKERKSYCRATWCCRTSRHVTTSGLRQV